MRRTTFFVRGIVLGLINFTACLPLLFISANEGSRSLESFENSSDPMTVYSAEEINYLENSYGHLMEWLFVLVIIISLFITIINLSNVVRRLHDINKSGWWTLVSMVPLVGAVVLLIYYFTDGTPGLNEYGPDPKQNNYRKKTTKKFSDKPSERNIHW